MNTLSTYHPAVQGAAKALGINLKSHSHGVIGGVPVAFIPKTDDNNGGIQIGKIALRPSESHWDITYEDRAAAVAKTAAEIPSLVRKNHQSLVRKMFQLS